MSTLHIWSGRGKFFFSFSLARWDGKEVDEWGGVDTEEVEGVSDGSRVGEVGRILAFCCTPRVFFCFFLSMLLSALLRLERFSVGLVSSSSSSLVLFKDDVRGGGISSTSISVSGRCCLLGCCSFCCCLCCCCCYFCWGLLLLLLLKLMQQFLLQRFMLLLLHILRPLLRFWLFWLGRFSLLGRKVGLLTFVLEDQLMLPALVLVGMCWPIRDSSFGLVRPIYAISHWHLNLYTTELFCKYHRLSLTKEGYIERVSKITLRSKTLM